MEYLIGNAILAMIWMSFYLRRRDLLQAMVSSGVLFVALMSIGFVAIKFLLPNLATELTIVPGYWNPDTLFDLGRRTGGYAIEDALYGFFTGGIAAAVYETFFRHRIPKRHVRHYLHWALPFSALGGGIAAAAQINLIWALIAFAGVGTAAMWYQRPDLIRHSIVGGISYLCVYIGFFLFFMFLFPNYIPQTYSFHNFLGLSFIGIPLEEYLYAFTFGLFWSPIYEYVKEIR